MKEEAEQNSEAAKTGRPDPFFKLFTRLEAEQLGLQAIETEQQYSPRADLILSVPPNLSLEGTMFDFFRALNVLEFKSENDAFNLREYIKNQLRTDLLFLQSNVENYAKILNIIVSSRLPQSFLNQAKERGLEFQQTQNKPWLWLGAVGFQDVAIVVCRELPVEKPYYNWLIFAPSRSTKWREYVTQLFKEGNISMLEQVKRVRSKEYNVMVNKSFDEIMAIGRAEGIITPEYEAWLEKEQAEAGEIALQYYLNKQPDKFDALISDYLSTQPGKLAQILANLSPEERTKLIKLLSEQSEKAQE